MFKPNFETILKKKEKNYAEFVLSPLEQGYGHTLGNALRRVLLTSLPGAAITQLKIKGVAHQFATLKGLKEDIIEFCLNIKKVKVEVVRGKGPFKVTLDLKGPGEVKAGDIKTPPEIKVINKDLVLGHLTDKKAHLQAEMQVEKGFGYRLASKKERKIGLISLDAVFSPIVRVAYKVKATWVGRRADFDKLIIKIWTDGTLKPESVLEEAARILASYFQQIYEPVFKKEDREKEKSVSSEASNLSVEEIDLPTRIANTLIKGGFKTVGDLCSVSREEILKTKSFGEKSLAILEKFLKKKGVKLAAQG